MQWRYNSLNAKSRDAARRLGFRFEGVFYSQRIVKGCNRDTAGIRSLMTSWPEVRAMIRNWLADENFDPKGAHFSERDDAPAPAQSSGVGQARRPHFQRRADDAQLVVQFPAAYVCVVAERTLCPLQGERCRRSDSC